MRTPPWEGGRYSVTIIVPSYRIFRTLYNIEKTPLRRKQVIKCNQTRSAGMRLFNRFVVFQLLTCYLFFVRVRTPPVVVPPVSLTDPVPPPPVTRS